MALLKKFASVSLLNGLLSGCNLGCTVLLVRWFGTAAYADYTMDLATVSLVTILLEVVPSSYLVFRVQDDPELVHGAAGLACLSALLIAILLFALDLFGSYHAFSPWIAGYGALQAVKRYLDIRLQSSGRLAQFFQIETAAAGLRLGLMGGLLWAGYASPTALWGSLSLSVLLAQSFWFARNRSELKPFLLVLRSSTWHPLLRDRAAYTPYYLGIGVKRVRDNLMPLLAGSFFPTKEAAGAFFLAYRGISFTCGQIRVVEGLLNHRKTLGAALSLPLVNSVIVALCCQLLCIAASVALCLVSGSEELYLETVIVLSLMVWPYVFSVLLRAQAYSKYHLASINASLVAYIAISLAAATSLRSLGVTSGSAFAFVLLLCELGSLGTIYYLERSRNEVPEALG
ncbi:hypothetical protein LPW11_18835 [Geomonas sp. RF6]|uniref:hypothetical protein n=1 Tax=Geomonas sp. RF6 TaxID=2897342 RepID=UPI001E5AF9E3|nr:hypothetical protein [Geomonas sp. RF6]UFS69928.1 hypothetical protein LPW11_18835 [Geomonas sp. RF6]